MANALILGLACLDNQVKARPEPNMRRHHNSLKNQPQFFWLSAR